MPKKLGRGKNERPLNKGKKRHFQGNQFTAEIDDTFVSTFAKKLKTADFSDIEVDISSNYVILHFLQIFNFLSGCLVCKSCHSEVKFSRIFQSGIAFKLSIQCTCETRKICSSPQVKNAYEINRRLMFAFRVLGLGQNSLDVFCSIMDISHSFSLNIYYSFLSNVLTATKSLFEVLQKKATKEEIEENTKAGNNPLHLTVSGDGSWRKRGFSSLFGITTLIGKFTNKIIDLVIKSSFCQSCANWKGKEDTEEYSLWQEEHHETCTANHDGSSGKMEVDAVKEMFGRSEDLLGVKYAYYIGDGDTKTFKAILDFDPYDDVTVKKKECVGHVQKRMGTRLRKVKKETIGLGGKGAGKLTDNLIKDLTVYYGLAIRQNSDSVEKMREAIWATYYHKISTDEEPQHDKCPEGETSWCKWRVAEANGTVAEFKHDPPLQVT